MKIHRTKKRIQGFSLVEMMVAISIFTIIMTFGVGALLSTTNAYKSAQNQKESMDALAFALESMTRDLRTGYNYYSGATDDSNASSTNNGSDDSIGFVASSNRGYFTYEYDTSNDTIVRTINDGNAVNLIDPEVFEVTGVSFQVQGAEDDNNQPSVLIRIQGNPSDKPDDTHLVQTTISQRALDSYK
jgi:prepilin-type N-terminal cleavage/methylation domain-containing protein